MTLTNKFLIITVSVCIAIIALIIDANTRVSYKQQIQTVVALTGFSDFRHSVSFLEPQNRAYKDYSYSLYPEMTPINYMDFVYAK